MYTGQASVHWLRVRDVSITKTQGRFPSHIATRMAILHPQHMSTSRANYGIVIAYIVEANHRVITRLHCTHVDLWCVPVYGSPRQEDWLKAGFRYFTIFTKRLPKSSDTLKLTCSSLIQSFIYQHANDKITEAKSRKSHANGNDPPSVLCCVFVHELLNTHWAVFGCCFHCLSHLLSETDGRYRISSLLH